MRLAPPSRPASSGQRGAGPTSLPGDWLNPEAIPQDRVAAEDPGGRARFGTMSW